MPTAALPASPAFQALQLHYAEARALHMRDLFATDTLRFDKFSLAAAGLFLDYSKNRITDQSLTLLLNLARERGVEAYREAMFTGEKINTTEDRAVLHTALRAPAASGPHIDGQDVGAEVHAMLQRMRDFSDAIRSGAWRGYTGQRITDIVNIGIGGSDLGPAMACRALRSHADPQLRMHFVANVDGHSLAATLAGINPATTLFIIASKTFTTAETMLNAHSARDWFLQAGGAQGVARADVARHFVAVSTNADGVADFGIDRRNMFEFWDWVGGRYSIWSAIGLPLMLAIGFDGFRAFLSGAHAMDAHFRSAPLARNMPVILALLGVWYRNFFGCDTLSIAPYHQDLLLFPSYLQQLDMESNGKSVTRDGQPLQTASGPVVWGNVGTNAQHAYFQLLHQGSDIVPVDFIACLGAAHDLPGHQAALLANCFAQSEAFMRGKNLAEVQEEMQHGVDQALAPHKVFAGNRPSNTLLLDELNPASLGALIALYEHKIFVQGVLWDINSFDQWGVELGKVLTASILDELKNGAAPDAHDASTNGLIARARAAL